MICAHCLYDDTSGGARCESCGRLMETPTGAPEPPLVGRARELARLDEALEHVLKNRVFHVVGLVGAPRSGRSRLMTRFRHRHDNAFSDLVAIRGYPVPGGRVADPFAPFGRLLRNAFRLDERAGPEEARRRVREAVEALAPPSLTDALRSLGWFMGLRFPETQGESAPAAGPEELRRRAFATYAWYVRRRAEQRPLLLLIEGLGEAAPDGLELLAYLRGHLREAPVLALCEVDRDRIDADPRSFERLGDTLLPIEPLDREAVGELMARLTDRATAPPPNLLDAVLEASGGRPEAVAHVVRTLQRQGVIEPGGLGWGVDPDEPVRFEFPLTPEQAARRRLARLDEDDRVWLRRAAVVGTVFWRGALVALARREMGAGDALAHWIELPAAETVDGALDRAIEAGVLHRMRDSGLDDAIEYAFTRPREQALLLEEIDPDERARMHAVVAQWMEYRAATTREQHLLAIAEHHRKGRNDKRAAFYYIMAGDRARRRYANDLAVEAFERALELLDERDMLPLLDVYHALGALHALAGRHDLAESCFERMLAGAWRLDHRSKAGAALNRLGRLYRDRCHYARARSLLEAGRALFAAADDGAGVAASIDDLGQVALREGRRDEATRLFEEALAYRRATDDARSIAVSLANLARARRDDGDLMGAEATLREARSIQEEIGDTTGLIGTLLELAEVLDRAGTPDAAAEQAEEALSLARRTGDRGQTARAAALVALLAADRGDAEIARAHAEEAGALAEQLGDDHTRVRALRASARVGARTGAPEATLETLEDAIRVARHHADRLELGRCLALAGALHAALSGVDLRLAADSAQAMEVLADLDAPAARHGTIDELIEDALHEAEDTVPPEVTALGAAARAHLDDAARAYGDALAALEEAGDEAALVHVLREMALVVAARGEPARAEALERRAARIEAERRERARA